MPADFVHGVPDTADPTKEAYVRWLLDELAAQPGPIDVVGHDWGALPVVRAVSLAPDRVRSRAVGGAPLAERPDAVAAELDRFWAHIRPGEPRDA